MSSTIASEPLSKQDDEENSPWLESPWWDGLWLFCGLWMLVPLMVVDVLNIESRVTRPLLLVGLALMWGGHIIAPIIFAWSQPVLRADLLRRKPMYIYWPLALFFGSIIMGAFYVDGVANVMPLVMMNYRFTGVGAALFLFFTLWNIWHFSAQHFGVLSIYRSRSQQFDAADKIWDRRFTVFITCILLPIAWYTQGRRLGILVDVLPAQDPHGYLAGVVIGLTIFATMAMLGYELRKPNRSLPRHIYIVSISVQPIFGIIAYSLYHFAIFSMAHWIVAIALVARVSSNSSIAYKEQKTSSRILSPFHVHVLAIFALSIPMYLVFESSAVAAFFANTIGSANGEWNTTVFAQRVVGIVAGGAVGIGFSHFIYDRYVYSFRAPIIRETVVPHLFNKVTH